MRVTVHSSMPQTVRHGREQKTRSSTLRMSALCVWLIASSFGSSSRVFVTPHVFFLAFGAGVGAGRVGAASVGAAAIGAAAVGAIVGVVGAGAVGVAAGGLDGSDVALHAVIVVAAKSEVSRVSRVIVDTGKRELWAGCM